MYTVKIIFGSDDVKNFYNQSSRDDETKITGVFEYSFETKKEIHAFIKGIDEAMGWRDYYVLDE